MGRFTDFYLGGDRSLPGVTLCPSRRRRRCPLTLTVASRPLSWWGRSLATRQHPLHSPLTVSFLGPAIKRMFIHLPVIPMLHDFVFLSLAISSSQIQRMLSLINFTSTSRRLAPIRCNFYVLGACENCGIIHRAVFRLAAKQRDKAGKTASQL